MANRKRHKTADPTTHPQVSERVQLSGEEYLNKLEEIAPKNSKQITKTPSGEIERNQIVTKIRHKPVTWGFCFDEVTFSKWVVNIFRLPLMPWDSFATTQSTYLPDARNTVHSNFLETECEYLVMLDSDVLPPPDFLDRLLAHHLPMVGGWYRKKGEPYAPVVYDYHHTDPDGIRKYNMRREPGKGLEQVDAAGAGCWLIRRDVAVAIGARPYSMEHGGEDLELCWKVKEANFPIHIDWDVVCQHCGVATI